MNVNSGRVRGKLGKRTGCFPMPTWRRHLRSNRCTEGEAEVATAGFVPGTYTLPTYIRLKSRVLQIYLMEGCLMSIGK